MEYNGIPIFNISLDDEDCKLICNSIVDEPAVMHNALFFSEDKKPLLFKIDNEDERIITGVSMIADTPIYRFDPTFGGYYVVFQKDTIKQLVERYAKDGYNNLVTYQHNGEYVKGFTMIESYFIDKERNIAPIEFQDVPDGSWITSYKVDDINTWNMIKNDENFNGFSVECEVALTPAMEGQKMEKPIEVQEDNEWEEFLRWLLGVEYAI